MTALRHIGGGRFLSAYTLEVTLGIPFYMFGQAMNPIIRADGSPGFAMISTLAGAVLNMILDPIFIFVFRWGMMGAAVALCLIIRTYKELGVGKKDKPVNSSDHISEASL